MRRSSEASGGGQRPAMAHGAPVLAAAMLAVGVLGCGGGGGGAPERPGPGAGAAASQPSPGTGLPGPGQATARSRTPAHGGPGGPGGAGTGGDAPSSPSPAPGAGAAPPPSGASAQEPVRTEAVIAGRHGRLGPAEIQVPPFVAVRIVLRSDDRERYRLSVAGRALAAGPGAATAAVTLPGLRPGGRYVARASGRADEVRIVASAEPGP